LLRLIVAVDSRNGIAKDGDQPWDIPEDAKYFLDTTKTKGANILMGYKTYQVMGHSLEARNNYILTREHANEQIEGAMIISDLDKFLNEFNQDLWVIGGADIYAQTISRASELYITKIHHDYGCDQFFPKYLKKFKLVFSEGTKYSNGVGYNYTMYQRS
jgi:dihydrofolate reductase